MQERCYKSYRNVQLCGALLYHPVLRCVMPCYAVQVLQLDEACRSAGVKFMAAAAAGPAGWYFADLLSHSYTPKVRGHPTEFSSRLFSCEGRKPLVLTADLRTTA